MDRPADPPREKPAVAFDPSAPYETPAVVAREAIREPVIAIVPASGANPCATAR